MTGGFRRKCGGHRGRTQRSAPTRAIVAWCRGRPPRRPADNGCTPVVPLIRHGFAVPPSPLRGEGYSRSVGSAQMSMAFPSSVMASPCHLPPGEGIVRANLAFPLPGGRWSRRDRMRVGIVGCGGHRTGGWGHPPLRRVTIDFVGAAVPSGPATTDAPPWSPSSVTALPCHLLPCGAKAIAAPSGALKCRYPPPHPSRLCRATFPQGKA